MATDSKKRPNTAEETANKKKGLFTGTLSFITGLAIALVISCCISIAIAWVGLTFIWPEEGAMHELNTLKTEYKYLNGTFKASLYGFTTVDFVSEYTEVAYKKIFEDTGLANIGSSVSNYILDNNSTSTMLNVTAEYLLVAKVAVQIFLLRLAVIIMSFPTYLMFACIGLVCGLVERDLRRWGGAAESAYVFHFALRHIKTSLIILWMFYLSWPTSAHPTFFIIPGCIAFGWSLFVTSKMFKKQM